MKYTVCKRHRKDSGSSPPFCLEFASTPSVKIQDNVFKVHVSFDQQQKTLQIINS